MYTCNHCKRSKEGNPATILGRWHNVLVCPECLNINNEKRKKVLQERAAIASMRDTCSWCDVALTDANRSRPKDDKSNVFTCLECHSGSTYRAWLERCLTAVGTSERARIMEYINLPKRQEKWEAIREKKRKQLERKPTLIFDNVQHNAKVEQVASKLTPEKLEKLLKLIDMMEEK